MNPAEKFRLPLMILAASLGLYFVNAIAAPLFPNELLYRVLLVTPILGFFIGFCRQVIGVHTFGVFTPMIIGLSFLIIGFFESLTLYTLFLLIGLFAHRFLLREKISSVFISSSLLYFITAVMAVLIISGYAHLLVAVGNLPFIITIHAIERFHSVTESYSYKKSVSILAQTFGLAVFSAGVSFLLLRLPVDLLAYLFVITWVANYYVARYEGMRLSEYFRFKRFLQ